MREKQRMLAGKLYMAGGGQLAADMKRSRALTRLFNATTEEQMAYRETLLRELFGSAGSDLYIEPPFRCDYGCQIHIGDRFYANYDCIILDICKVTIGDNVMFGPRVCIYTAGHPLDARVRDTLLEFGKPVTIGDSVWVGGNTVIAPGVTIGSGTVIGAGSVVTKDIPPGVVAMGNPCRVYREVGEADRERWEGLRAEYEREKNGE